MKLFLILFFFLSNLLPSERTSRYGYDIGDFAIDFKLKNVDGQKVSLADYKDAKGFIVVFTCNECPYSLLYEDRIIALHNKFADKGYPVIAINANDAVKSPADSYEKIQKRAKSKKFPFPYLFDETQEVTKTYGATNTPHSFVLHKENGKYKVCYIGAIDDNPRDVANVKKKYVEEAIYSLIEGRPILTTKTKAIGCTIKWRS